MFIYFCFDLTHFRELGQKYKNILFVFGSNLLLKFTDLFNLATNSVKQPPKFDNNEPEGLYWKTSDVHTATSWWKLQLVFGRHEHSTFIGKIFSNLDPYPKLWYVKFIN